jgi:hypothetical protein
MGPGDGVEDGWSETKPIQQFKPTLPSKGWWQRFMMRHQELSLRTPSIINAGRLAASRRSIMDGFLVRVYSKGRWPTAESEVARIEEERKQKEMEGKRVETRRDDKKQTEEDRKRRNIEAKTQKDYEEKPRIEN